MAQIPFLDDLAAYMRTAAAQVFAANGHEADAAAAQPCLAGGVSSAQQTIVS